MFFRILLVVSVSATLLAEPAAPLHEVLQQRLLQIEAERDQSERAYLRLQAETRPVIERLTTEQTALREELDSSNRRIVQLESARLTADAAVSRAEQELREKVSELTELEQRMTGEQQAFAETLNQLRDEQVRMQEARGEESTAFSERERELATELEKLLERMTETERRANSLRTEKDALAREASEIRGLNQQLVTDLDSSRRREELANAQMLALQRRVEDLQQQLHQAFADRSRAEEERDQLADRVRELEAELADARENRVPREVAEALRNELERARSENQKLAEALEQERNRPDFTTDLARTQRERDLLDAKLKTLESKLAEAEAQALAEAGRQEQIRGANQSLVELIASLEQSLNQSQSRLEERDDALRELGSQVQQLSETREAIQTELGRTRAALEEQQAAAAVAADQFSELQAQQRLTVSALTDERLLREEQDREIQDLQLALGRRVQELEASRERMEALEAQKGSPAALERERARHAALQERSRGDMRVLASHIRRLREDLNRQQQAQIDAAAEREVLLLRIRELESIPRVSPRAETETTPGEQ